MADIEETTTDTITGGPFDEVVLNVTTHRRAAPDPPPVNPQITDAITQVNVKTLGDASAMAAAHLFQTMAHSSGIMFENQVAGQQNLNAASQAASVTGVSELFTVDTAAQAAAAAKLNASDLAELMASLKAALKPAGS